MLASGQVFTRAEERSVTTRTVTLALTPEQVDILVAARAKGQLSLALRGVNDHEVVARPKPRPAARRTDARWKAEEEKRQKLERELAELKAALAARPAAPARAAPPARPPAAHVHDLSRRPDRPAAVALDGAAGGRAGRGARPDDPGLDASSIARAVRGPGGRPGPQAEATALLPRADGIGAARLAERRVTADPCRMTG